MINTLINVYLPHFFDWLIETSLMASILVGFILCIKVLFRNKLTPRWQYMLWIVLMIRLLLPWSPDSSYSIYSLLSYSSSVSEVIPKNMPATENIVNIESDRKVELESNSKMVTKTSEPEVKVSSEKQTTFSLYKLALYVWLAGVIILAAITFLTNRRLYSYIKKQPDITDEQVTTVFNRCKQSMKMKKAVSLRLAGKIASPTVFSFFRPKVLLSKKHMKVLNEQQLQYVFYHELAHIKRNDVAVNWIMYSLILLNWFNPILWYAYFCMREDQELACDAYALTFIDKEEQIAYGHTIITLLEHYSYQLPSLANLSRNKRTLKRRIIMIKKFQKKSYRLSLLGVIVIVAIASLSLFNARATEGKEKQKDKVEQSKDAFQHAVDMLFGTEENAKKEYRYSARVYENKTDYLYLAEKALTTDEFQQYIKLYKEIINIQKKGAPRDSDYESIFFREERLTETDREKLYALYDQSKPFNDKVEESLNYTVKEAQEHVDFQIKKPTYTIEGYDLKDEKVSCFIKRRPELIIELEYTNGKGNYTTYQSQVFGESKDPFHGLFVVEENIEQYELEGNQIFYATHNSDRNLQGMKMIVPAKGKNRAYQIVIINHSLENPGEAVFDKNVNKEELEKIMLSMLK
ncbi:M56 family metallopeptidase [Bacillus cereus]|uniref:M56 family metallopeptidase n=4 Tax=Bacillus TaxID=1386 RepID=A0A643MY48_BACTU|nr:MULTISPECIES: M56 family metallopeptidase [Bacillus cereus group]AHZ49977.1 beta-lactamase regulatory protein [Bacillus thuringiensis serovar kurstaki str. YBT-1520]AIE32351.1 beta-lactamase regulatory protein [Bacillus thuringiensis serovar kurstaki str. HD-1]AJK44212.1 peptidase M48 family protein [Bacillus thuringiensis serovar kurstaki]AKJ58251.1 methicillin resistance protein [Bacillus thuringiensis]ALL60937.1 methicillin resistance protein [Bacillus thuringiensis]